jgi:hypothetical protein
MQVVITPSPRDYAAVPELPWEIERLDMCIRYRGHSLDLRLTRDSLTVHGHDDAAAPISLCIDGKLCEFLVGTTRVFQLNGKSECAIAENKYDNQDVLPRSRPSLAKEN